uniref:Uncharacterized protein n=1 Tax=Ornithorhynchus anatinus TaxID=9258 RepID=A0A6I8PK89_ORNAN
SKGHISSGLNHSVRSSRLVLEEIGRRMVKSTGSVRYTRLDSLLIEAEITWEFTAMVLLRPTKSPASFMVAFSVLRNCPKLLYIMNTNFARPEIKEGENCMSL